MQRLTDRSATKPALAKEVKRGGLPTGQHTAERGIYRVPDALLGQLRRFNISSTRLAKMLGKSQNLANQKLLGRVRWTYDDLWKVAEGLNVPIKWLVD